MRNCTVCVRLHSDVVCVCVCVCVCACALDTVMWVDFMPVSTCSRDTRVGSSVGGEGGGGGVFSWFLGKNTFFASVFFSPL